jgi:hypothetical protein
LSKRGWSENAGAVVEPGDAVITFATADGPALLRLTHRDGRTIADLSLRKPATTNADILPMPGQARLLLGNAANEEAVITINEQTIKLAARAGLKLTDDPETGRKSPDSQEINLQPGKYKVTLEVASDAAQTGSSRSLPARPGDCWSVRPASRSTWTFIDMRGSSCA